MHKDKTYGELSKLFGVCETTINSWCLKNGIRCKAAEKKGGKQSEDYLSIEENIKELKLIHKNSILCVTWFNNKLDKVSW